MLQRIDIMTPEDGAELIARRQQVVDWLQGFDERLAAAVAKEPGAAAAVAVAAFRIFQAETIKQVLDTDGLTIALAKERLSSIAENLRSFAKGKQIRNAYERADARERHRLNGML